MGEETNCTRDTDDKQTSVIWLGWYTQIIYAQPDKGHEVCSLADCVKRRLLEEEKSTGPIGLVHKNTDKD